MNAVLQEYESCQEYVEWTGLERGWECGLELECSWRILGQ